MTRIALLGAGRMSAAIVGQAVDSGDIEVCSIVSRQAPEWLGDLPFFSRLDELDSRPDVLVDFSLPAGTVSAAEWCGQNGIALLSGVTGLGDSHLQALQQAARTAPVLWSPNLSVGVNLLAKMLRQAVSALPSDVRVHINDIHHQHKKDAPSGTALFLGEQLLLARPELEGALQYSSQREGEIIGQHSVSLDWAGERLTLGHQAFERGIFARGALSAACWLAQQAPDWYSADDWLSGVD